MKKINQSIKIFHLLLLVTFGSLIAFGQDKPAPYELNIGGVKVIVQPSGNEIVEIQTVIKGGVQNYSVAQQGIESLAINALTECGNKKMDKNAFKNELDKVSAQIGGNSGKDYSTISLNCIKSDFSKVWPLYVDAITEPVFNKDEFERIKQDAINELRSQESQPDYSIDNMAKQAAFAGKDYAKRPEGTVATVTNITAELAKAYYASILTRSRMVIVVVASLSKDEIEASIEALLASIPQGKAFELKKGTVHPVAASFKAEKKALATNYIQGVTSAPEPGSADYNAFVLAMRIFSQRHFLEVRTNNGLSYAPGSWFDGGASPTANISVSTTNPNKYIGVVKSLIEKTKTQGFTEEELKDIKTGYLTSFFYRQETNSAQANALAMNEVLHNNWKRSVTISDDMKKVSLKELNATFNKYFNNIVWVYQGNPTQVNPALFKGPAKPQLPKSKVVKQKKN
ncbi:MAG: hypothetical protein RLY16_1450 [Bacteroidota bacterium]|jgi:predicted Zn-dependent peptidase